MGHKKSITVFGAMLASVAALLLVPGTAFADPPPGECNSGFCGTPNNNGGGCSCSCGGSILVNNTDVGKTYSTSDDYDGDGIVDDHDNCPFIANRDQADSDGDKIGNACDNCTNVSNHDQSDINGNHIGDACDPDMDGDKILNAVDNCVKVPNVDQGDINKNGIGDACDPDMDGDGVLNRVDNCPRIYNPDQSKTIPGLNGNACDNDLDKDGVEDARDNCPGIFNPDQKDINANGIGDLCDPDMDGDTVANLIDNCPQVPNLDQKDSDKDGVGDACSRGFCFVAGKNRSAACLDPKNVFQVTAAPEVNAGTGEQVFLSIYSNRAKDAPASLGDVTIKYSWAVVAAPEGSNDTVSDPTGAVSTSEGFEYRYQDKRPVFTPRLAGTYKLKLVADLTQNDPLFPGAQHAESEVSINVTGDPKTGGCSLGGSRTEGFTMISLLGFALLIARRRRFAK